MGPGSPLKRSISYSGSSNNAHGQSFHSDHKSQSGNSSFSLPSPYTPSQFPLTGSGSYPLAPLPDNIDHTRVSAEKRDLKTPKRASLQPPAPIQRSYSQPAFPAAKDASPRPIISSPSDSDPHFEFEPIVDDGTKPPFSYAHLIGMAILRSPQRRLTLNQIYTWIMTTFDYYRAEAQPQTNWQNSIRHNLSLNKAFVKEERPKDEPGKGHYWKIVPGAEPQFAKGGKGRRPVNQHRNSTGNMPPPAISQSQFASAAALAYHSMPNADDYTIPVLSREPEKRRRANSNSSNESGRRSRKNSNNSKLPVFEMEPPNPSIVVAPPRRLQESPILPPSIDTPPPSQDAKGDRKRKAFRDSGYFGTPDGPDGFDHDGFRTTDDEDHGTYHDTSKRPRLDSTLSESRIIARPPPHSFHNLSIISPPPSSSPQRPPMSSARKVAFTTPRAQISRRLQEAPPSTCSPQTRLQLHREDINRYLSSPAKSVIFESSFDDPYLEFENSPAKFQQFHDGPDDVVLRYAYGSPARRETKRRNYWRRLHSGFDPADIDGEGDGDATEVYGVDLGYIYRASLKNDKDDKAEGEDEEAEDAEEVDGDYHEEHDSDTETEVSSSSSSDEEEEVVGSLEWDEEYEEAFNELSPP
jgi:forkhead transcription factor HCM1